MAETVEPEVKAHKASHIGAPAAGGTTEVIDLEPLEIIAAIRAMPAHISRTSGSAGREMPTHKVRICQSDEEVCPFLLGQPCACPTKEAP